MILEEDEEVLYLKWSVHGKARLPYFETFQPPASSKPKPHIALARRSKGRVPGFPIGSKHCFSYHNADLFSEDRALVAELRETVGKAAVPVPRKKESRPVTIHLHGNSTPEEVSLWLQEKGFSLRLAHGSVYFCHSFVLILFIPESSSSLTGRTVRICLR